MPLYHPDLPGSVAQGDAFRRSSWREWDDLTPEEQEAHAAAVEAAEKAASDEVRERQAAWAQAVSAAADTAAVMKVGDQALSDLNDALGTGEVKKRAPRKSTPRKSTRKAPKSGDTTKE